MNIDADTLQRAGADARAPRALYVDHRAADADAAGAAGAAGAARLPLVMLHGWGMNLRVFDALREHLAAHETIAIDLPGHGRSPWWPDASFDSFCDAVLDALPPRCVLLGWSLGAKVAMALAARAPERITALVLLSATPKFAQSDDWPQGMPQASLRAFRSVLEQDWRQTIEDFIWLQVRGSQRADEVVASLQAAMQSHGEPRHEALLAGMRMLESIDLRDTAAHVTQPVLLITGRNDRVTSPQAAEWLAETMPQATLKVLPRAGHAPQLSHVQDVAEAIQAFLAANAQVGS